MNARVILHSDLNNFFASVEAEQNPELLYKPMVVCGDEDARHGIVLAKNYPAKALGIRTAEVIWQAKQKCPNLILVPPSSGKYPDFAGKARQIYAQFTDQIEPFGLDEAWLDVSQIARSLEEGRRIADVIRGRIRKKMGITASVGVADNKVFAKLGSDLKKPDGTTLISEQNYRQLVWPLPVGELLYAGPATCQRLRQCAIYTIGDLARAPKEALSYAFGKAGETLWSFANGLDASRVSAFGHAEECKSIGNSTTPPRDIKTMEDARRIAYLLAEEVAQRMREEHVRGRVISLSIRDVELSVKERQAQMKRPSYLSGEIAGAAVELLAGQWHFEKPLRSMGIRMTGLISDAAPVQLNMFENAQRQKLLESMEFAMDGLRGRYGGEAIRRGMFLCDATLIAPKARYAPEGEMYEKISIVR